MKEIEFLKELQKELLSQDHDSQAAPRFWALMDYKEVPTAEGHQDRISYYHHDGDFTEFKNVGELKEFLEEHYLEDDEDGELRSLISSDNLSFENLWAYTKTVFNDDGYFDEVPVKEESFIVPNTMFLTKAEAKKHIELNHYHYTKKVHTYAMTAWRAPQVQELWRILETFDWDSVKENK